MAKTDKQEEISENTIKTLRKERDAAVALAESLQQIVPIDVMLDGMLGKVVKLSQYNPAELESDRDTLDEFIEEAQAVVKTAKLANKLLDKQ